MFNQEFIFEEMDNTNSTAKTDHVSPSDKVECLVKEVDLKTEMEKAKEWAKNNPIPTCKCGLVAHVCMNNIYVGKKSNLSNFS